MSDAAYTTKQIKLFGKIHQEFLNEYNVITNQPLKIFKIKKSSILLCYLEDVSEVIDDFLDCKENCLKEVTLFKLNGINSSKAKLNWKYLHNLFWIVKKDKTPEILERSKAGISNSELAVLITPKGNLNGSKNSLDSIQKLMSSSIFGNIIKEMSGDIQKSLEGKDLSMINPSELLSSLMGGETKVVGGIDFSSIIEKSTKSLKTKVENGEIDLNQLKESASSIAGSLGGFNLDLD